MKKIIASFTALFSLMAMATDVTIELDGGRVSAPSCETEVQAVRTNGSIILYLNGGKYCNYAIATNNGVSVGSQTLPKLLGQFAGSSIVLPEVEGENNYQIRFYGKDREDKISLKVTKVTIGPKIDVKVNLQNPTAELSKCGGIVSIARNTLRDIIVTFSGIDSCHYGSVLLKNGNSINPPITFDIEPGGSMVRLVGSETHIEGKNTVVYKLWSEPSIHGNVIRETVEVSFDKLNH